MLFGLPWWLSGKESACKQEITGLIPGSGRLFINLFSVFKIFSIHCESSPQGFCSELVSFS